MKYEEKRSKLAQINVDADELAKDEERADVRSAMLKVASAANAAIARLDYAEIVRGR